MQLFFQVIKYSTNNNLFFSTDEDFRATSRTDSLQWWALLGTTAFTWASAAIGLYLRFVRGCRAKPSQGQAARQDQSARQDRLEMLGDPIVVNHYERK